MNDKSSSLVKNTTLLSFGTLCSKGIMFIMLPLFSHWLSKEDFGTFDLITTYITLLLPIVTLSLGDAVFRFILDKDENENKDAFVSTALLANIISFAIVIIFGIIFSFLFPERLVFIILIIGYLGSEMLFNLLLMILRGNKMLLLYMYSNIIFVVFMAICTTVFVRLLSYGLYGLLLGYSCGYFLAIIYILLGRKTKIVFKKKYISINILKKMVTYSMPLIPNLISWWIINASDRSIISYLSGTAVNAVYAVSNKLPALSNLFNNSFHLAWQQNAIEVIDSDYVSYHYNNVYNNMLRIILSFSILILGINYWFFTLLFPSGYFYGVYQTPILTFANVFSVLSGFLGGIYIAQKKTLKSGISTAIAAIVNLTIHLSFVKIIGLYAASISTFIAYLVLFIFRYIDLRRNFTLFLEGKTIILCFTFIIAFAASFWINNYFQTLFLLLAFLIFVLSNKQYVKAIYTRLTSKIKYKGKEE